MRIWFRSEEWIPPVMYYYSKFKENRLEEFLKLLEFKFAGDWICGITPTLRLDAMNEILKVIESIYTRTKDDFIKRNFKKIEAPYKVTTFDNSGKVIDSLRVKY